MGRRGWTTGVLARVLEVSTRVLASHDATSWTTQRFQKIEKHTPRPVKHVTSTSVLASPAAPRWQPPRFQKIARLSICSSAALQGVPMAHDSILASDASMTHCIDCDGCDVIKKRPIMPYYVQLAYLIVLFATSATIQLRVRAVENQSSYPSHQYYPD